ncbi:MAG: ABC transporter permease [bacterium]|jgi:putative ABC transport system permease protein|nr:MAG: ABC transporter permease [bacterium]
MDRLLQDLRHAARALRNAPGFTILAVIALAIGVGANSAIFSLVNAVLLRPLPVEGLDRLHVVRVDVPLLDLYGAPLAPPEVLELAEREDAFEAVTGYLVGDRTLTGHGEPQRVGVAMTLGDFAGVFRLRPRLGRFYRPEQSLDGTHRVAVVSHGLWQQLSGGDPGFVGRTLELNGESYEVVGVMPPAMRFPRGVQVWVPFALPQEERFNRNRWVMTAVVRTRPGVGEAQLAAHLAAEARRWNDEYHGGGDVKVLRSTPFVQDLAGPLRTVLLVLLGAVGFVLLLAAANVASLQLVRAVARSKELAVRAALGAGRGRLARQLLAESALLALLGGMAGLWLGSLALAVVARWQPAQQMNLTDVPLDGAVLAFTAFTALLAALASGLVPALRAARVDPQRALRESGHSASAGRSRHRLLRAGSVLQVALALVLLLGSGLMVRTLSRLLAADPGFDPRNVHTAQVSIPSSVYDSPERRLAFFDALLERARALPGVEHAALIQALPFSGMNDSSPFAIIGRPTQEGDPARHAEARVVSADYFRTMGIPVLAGRVFDDTERPGTPRVVVIDRTFAEQYFPGEDPIGKQIASGWTSMEPATIIGVVGSVDHDEVADAPKAVAYYPFRHAAHYTTYALALRSAQSIGGITNPLRAILAELDPNVPLYDVQTMEGRIERSLGPRRLAMLALAGFAALAVVLAALGIYGVMRYTTGQRTHEIGIRIAIGAQRGDVVRLVLRQGMTIVAAGLGIGLAAALVLTRTMRAVLFGVGPHDPLTFIVATALLAGVALIAIWLPARRATRVDPITALRVE